MKVTRRDVLGSLSGLLLGTAMTGLATKEVFGARAEEPTKLPWPYEKLDLNAVGKGGYEGYIKGACCYGAFSAIINELAKNVGSPYTSIPTEMWVVGEGGMAGTSNFCGALNGASFAIFLVTGGIEKREKAFDIVKDLYHWYEQTGLPIYKPEKPKIYDGEIVKSKSGSPLCHVSVTNWCKASGFKSFSPARNERCGRLAASVAVHTVELLNNYFAGSFQRSYNLSAAAESCRSCHDKGSALENTRGIQECGQCHFNLGTEHPKVK
ncbi:MAG: C-GCAxxG-C-C family (seleno)protein [Thermodesulfobacteriota bacterium]